jgi:hypothetical protein
MNTPQIPWPPYAIAIAGLRTNPQPYVVRFEDGGIGGRWPLSSVTTAIVLQLRKWERTNAKNRPARPDAAVRQAREEIRAARLELFNPGEALGEAGTTHDLQELIASGIWTLDQIYRYVGEMARAYPDVAAHWPTRAKLWRAIKDPPSWARSEKKRRERIVRFDTRLKPEEKAHLVAGMIHGAITKIPKK